MVRIDNMVRKPHKKILELKQNKNKMKGQIAFEFLLIYGVFILLFLGAMWMISQRATYSQFYAESIFAREIASRFAEEINLASRFDGYEKTYQFPKTIRGAPYTLMISNGMLQINYTSVTEVILFYPLATREVRKETTRGSTTFDINITEGMMIIKNINGTVVISQ